MLLVAEREPGASRPAIEMMPFSTVADLAEAGVVKSEETKA